MNPVRFALYAGRGKPFDWCADCGRPIGWMLGKWIRHLGMITHTRPLCPDCMKLTGLA